MNESLSAAEMAELNGLVDRLREEGTLPVDEAARLERWVIDSPAARWHYVQVMNLRAGLDWDRTGEAELPPRAAPLASAPIASAAAVAPRGSWLQGSLAWANRPLAFSLIFATVFLWAALTLLATWGTTPYAMQDDAPPSGAAQSSSEPAALATLTGAVSCRWSDDSEPAELAARLSAGRLHLEAGVAELKFDTGTAVLLEGPVELELISASEVRLRSGRLVARVPTRAKGFVIAAPHARIEDLGTEFGVTVTPDWATDVVVYAGRVRVHTQSTGGEPIARDLTAGEAVRVPAMRAPQTPTIQPLVAHQVRHVRQLPADEHELGPVEVVRISTLEGIGADTFIRGSFGARRFAKTNYGGAPLLQLKHSRDMSYCRKVYLRFDLTRVQSVARLRDVALTLAARGASNPDGKYLLTLYGLESPGEWIEGNSVEGPSQGGSLCWNNAPAHDLGGPAMLPKVARKLAEIKLPSNLKQGESLVLSNADSVASDRLRSFLERRLGSIATLVLVTSTADFTTPDPIGGWQFVTKENLELDAEPPTLELLCVTPQNASVEAEPNR